jgi:hypothetical protein
MGQVSWLSATAVAATLVVPVDVAHRPVVASADVGDAELMGTADG